MKRDRKARIYYVFKQGLIEINILSQELRGSQASARVLMYQGSLSGNARERLAVMRESNDGFVLARKDLEIRVPGEVLGTRQTGMVQMRIADLQRDRG